MTKFFVAIFTNLLLVLVVGCVGNITSVLDDTTCQAPCWRGINMGTTKEEAINMLRQMPDIEKETITIDRTERPYMDEVIHWKYKGNKDIGNIVLIGNRVAEMYFPLMNKDLSLATLENLYGEPQTIILKKERLDATFLSLYLFYQQQGICLEVQPSTFPLLDPDTYRIAPSTKVSSVYYVDPRITDWQTKLGCEAGIDANDYNKLIQKWTGYSNYKVYELGGNE